MRRVKLLVSEIIEFLGDEVLKVFGPIDGVYIDNSADAKHVNGYTLDYDIKNLNFYLDVKKDWEKTTLKLRDIRINEISNVLNLVTTYWNEQIESIRKSLLDIHFPKENEVNVFEKFSNRYERHIAYALEQIRGFLLCNIDYKNSKVEHHIKNKNYIYTLNVGDENEIRYVQKLYKSKLKEGINRFYVVKNDIHVENFYDLDFLYFYNFVEIVNNVNEIEHLDNNIYIEV